MNTVTGNLLHFKTGLLVHQVNCLGACGAGIALALAEAYPKMKREYLRKVNGTPRNQRQTLLGQIQPVLVAKDLRVVNLFGQHYFGPGDRQYTSYDAHEMAWPLVSALASKTGLPVLVPHLIGCNLAGGDWAIVSKIIEKHCPHATIVKLPQA